MACALLLLTGCSSPEGGQESAGRALSTDGTQSRGTVGNEHAKVGQRWWFALPVPHNISTEPIEITKVELANVPDGLKVAKYGAYSQDDTEGLPLLAMEGDKFTPNFARLKDHSTSPLAVKPGQDSVVFYTARFDVTKPPGGIASGCRFHYQQGDQAYVQTLDCEVELKVG
ncbi:hypothetical protein [Streptomyces clavifer]|uniref:hypothetical protein n=1 Tax=Streptomyces clavifer TaxID=68188 RepID=UPI00381D2F02